jgi:hypothetical protein
MEESVRADSFTLQINLKEKKGTIWQRKNPIF